MGDSTTVSVVMIVTVVAILAFHAGASFLAGRYLSLLPTVAVIFTLVLINMAIYAFAAGFFGILTAGSPPYSGKPEDKVYQAVFGLVRDPCIDVTLVTFGLCLPLMWPLAFTGLGATVGWIGKMVGRRTKMVLVSDRPESATLNTK